LSVYLKASRSGCLLLDAWSVSQIVAKTMGMSGVSDLFGTGQTGWGRSIFIGLALMLGYTVFCLSSAFSPSLLPSPP